MPKPSYKSLDLIDINYSIRSGLGMMEVSRFAQNIIGDIDLTDEHGNKVDTIGLIEGYKLLFDTSTYSDTFDISDVEATTMDVAGALIDFETNTWNEDLYNFFKGDIWGEDLLILCRIQILPKYKGKGIGKKVIKDFYNNFVQGCGIFGLKCFPLQHEAGILDEESINLNPLKKEMNYQSFERNYEKAYQSLHSYYERIGFIPLPFDPKIMVINPAMNNTKFSRIKLD